MYCLRYNVDFNKPRVPNNVYISLYCITFTFMTSVIFKNLPNYFDLRKILIISHIFINLKSKGKTLWIISYG